MATRTFTIDNDGSQMKFEALDDGRVKITTGEVGAEMHTNAEGMLKMLNDLLGGGARREARGDYDHEHHTHEGDHHHGH